MLRYNSYIPTSYETQFVGNLLNIEPNDISYMFFSDKNIDNINTNLIDIIKQLTFERYEKKIVIEPQKKTLLVTIMRHVYFRTVQNKECAMIEVELLNKEVLYQIVPVVITELLAQMRYINDYNNIIPLELPQPAGKYKQNLSPYSDLFDFKPNY